MIKRIENSLPNYRCGPAIVERTSLEFSPFNPFSVPFKPIIPLDTPPENPFAKIPVPSYPSEVNTVTAESFDTVRETSDQ